MSTPDNQNNLNDLISPLNRIATALEETQLREATLEESEKMRAAYALNLCLVSVSQIVDYADLYVLEQEYTGILNNLNLENMPKDEALLDILRQLLDTITFFRIQNEEKVFIEREYKNKMKTAIWRAMPNCQVILGAGHWVAMLVTLACQIGTGYMNYRNEMALASFGYDKEMMQLHTAAIEQFNGLRRELFTTAWRLADKYQFTERWRLTESQIAQYNSVLMDNNLHRRWVRLENLEKYFDAYPPFWYFKGHTALQLSDLFYAEDEFAKCEEARLHAKSAFRHYFSIIETTGELLRIDPIGAACALEYSALLDKKNFEERLNYIHLAIQKAGNHYDVLQLCATAYLDLNALDLAVDLLRDLVCEGYNTRMNAQILSTIYIGKALQNKHNYELCRSQYGFLGKIVPESELLPWPDGNDVKLEEQYRLFIDNRRKAMQKSYAELLARSYSYENKKWQFAINSYSDQREHILVEATEQLYKELASFPCVEMDRMTFVHLVKPYQGELESIVKSGRCTNKSFETVFGDVFLYVARNIANTEITTMEQISQLEIELSNINGKYAKLVSSQNSSAEQKNFTIRDFFDIEDESSRLHKCIKEKIKSYHLVNEGSKHTKLLLSGEQEFFRYIKRNLLEQSHIVAIINDRSALDCDLIFTESGLIVRERQSGIAVGAKWFVFGPLALIDVGSNAIFPCEVGYSEIEYKEDHLTKPRYRNKEVNMEELLRLIEEIKSTCVDTSIEHRISNIIQGISLNN